MADILSRENNSIEPGAGARLQGFCVRWMANVLLGVFLAFTIIAWTYAAWVGFSMAVDFFT
jgi:hypothetical protein